MGEIFNFRIEGNKVRTWGNKKPRMQLSKTQEGCNEPYKDRFYCPKKKWFMKVPCPFEGREDCRNMISHEKCRGGF